MLEELLTDYSGTLLLVSHDRAFLNNLVTSTLVFEEDGQVREYIGGYDDWLRQRSASPVALMPKRGPTKIRESVARPGTKLSYKFQRELQQLPDRIEQLEQQRDALQARMTHNSFYQQSGDRIAAAQQELVSLSDELEEAYGRWERLESGEIEN